MVCSDLEFEEVEEVKACLALKVDVNTVSEDFTPTTTLHIWQTWFPGTDVFVVLVLYSEKSDF